MDAEKVGERGERKEKEGREGRRKAGREAEGRREEQENRIQPYLQGDK